MKHAALTIAAVLAALLASGFAPSAAYADGVTVQFAKESASELESVLHPTIGVTLSAPSTETITVKYAVLGGDATRGTAAGGNTDYILSDGTLTFTPGATTQSLPIEVINDTLSEPPETVIIALSAPTSATLGTVVQHTFTIQDDDLVDQAWVAFASPQSSGDEAVGTAKIPVVLTGKATATVSVTYSVVGGTAVSGSDYTLAKGTLEFAVGEKTKIIPIAIVDDTDVEESETIVLRLGTPTNATLGSEDTHTYTILDNDKPPDVRVSFPAPASTGQESASSVLLPVVLTGGPPTEAVSVSYRVAGGTATGNGVDYTLAAGTLVFATNETRKTIPLTIQNDTLSEADETVIVELHDPQHAQLGATASHTYTIVDDDLVNVFFSQPTSEVVEAKATTSARVQLSARSERPVRVTYSVTGSATQGKDYECLPGSVVFRPGETEKFIDISVYDDDEVEEDETVVLTLSAPVNATLGNGATTGDTGTAHTLTIRDNDTEHKITVEFAEERSQGDESAATVPIAVQLSSPSTSQITVGYTVSGTATSGSDYTLDAGTVTFAPGDTSATITATVTDDTDDEADETIVLTLSHPVNAKLGTKTVHTYWILDNDFATADLFLFKQVVGTVNNKKLAIIGPKAANVNVRGIAEDWVGNRYISDWGPTPGGRAGEGSILMWAGGPYFAPIGGSLDRPLLFSSGQRNVVRIIQGLTQPGDVEMSADNRALIIAGPAGKVERVYLGLSIRLVGIDPFEGNIVMHVLSDLPEKVVKVSPDGLFHVLGLKDPANKRDTVDISVDWRGETQTFTEIPLALTGHRIAQLELKKSK